MAKCTYEGIKFHSKIEKNVYKVLLKYFKEDDFERQKRYFPNRKFTCDFYFAKLNPPTWIEVSSYLKPRNIAKIKKKKAWIESRNELFLFVSDPLILENQLRDHFNNIY
ncbi:MAG: hypothetical protein H8D97_00850 [Proteobacteria bacterium]|nr:hypothetical protein [Pseudomonadota bacterium]